ncbi:hypothetical protein K501DRAFT_173473 [Backusella circina FSU 941]|nr:hypothetical protein K501DRAFT_173473 [Backusella circina FSU 941]
MSLLKNESTWQHKVVGAAGTTAAVISEDSMKYLRYCVNWLQYALQHIAQQMHMLRAFLVSLAMKKKDDNNKVTASIKQDMVLTLRKVVDIISGCTALPSNAKTTVRNVILGLPQRWSALNTDDNDNTDNKNQEDALRLLTFGQESTDMLQSIHSIFQDTIQRAESWLEKLKLLKSTDNNEDNELIHNMNQLQLSTSST